MSTLDQFSTTRPLRLKYNEAVPGFLVETSVLSIDRLEGRMIVVDWESGCPARISGMDGDFDSSTPLTYEVLRPHDNTVSSQEKVWVSIPD